MSDGHFFKALGRKLSRRANDSFDGEFWSKFEAEFTGQARPAYRHFWLDLRFLVPVGASLLLVLFVWRRPGQRHEAQPVTAEMVSQASMLQDLDLFLSPAPGAKTDFASLSEEEWDVLLKEKEG